MKNKKAQVAEVTLIVIALLVSFQAIYSTVLYHGESASYVSPPKETLDFFSNLNKLDIFNRESGKLAISEAYARSIAKPANCKIIFSDGKPISVWNETCGPDNNLVKEEFSKQLSAKFIEISSKQKFKISLDKNVATFEPSEIQGKITASTNVLKYDVMHQLYSPFSLAHPDLDIKKIYSEYMSRKSTCTTDGVLSENCMKSLEVKGWSSSLESAEYLVFILKSDKSYFYGSGFQPAEIKFALQRLS